MRPERERERAFAFIYTLVCCVCVCGYSRRALTADPLSHCRPKRRMATERRRRAFSAPSASTLCGSLRLCSCLSLCSVYTAAQHGHSVCLIERADTHYLPHIYSGSESAECLPRSLSVSHILSHSSLTLSLYTCHFAAPALGPSSS